MKKEETKKEVQSVPAPKFSIEQLRENCKKLFGVTTSTFNGATYNLKGKYNVSEMKAIIEKWKNKEVK
ncbi:MAG: hypothetical protein E7508_04880 [Ruminococcus sp.]|nr:hypothetical protein [Ruminococcus sp.]